MNVAAPELAPIFRSDAQGELLAVLLLNPDRDFTIAELASVTGTPYASTHREVRRLLRSGLLVERRVGRHHQLSADTTSRAYGPLVELLLLSYGPATVLPDVLSPLDGIDAAYIYGSWAARRAGEPGSPPGDVDVLVVGNPARSEIHGAAEQAEQALGREVNIRIVSASAWKRADDPFVRTLKDRPLAELDLAGARS